MSIEFTVNDVEVILNSLLIMGMPTEFTVNNGYVNWIHCLWCRGYHNISMSKPSIDLFVFIGSKRAAGCVWTTNQRAGCVWRTNQIVYLNKPGCKKPGCKNGTITLHPIQWLRVY